MSGFFTGLFGYFNNNPQENKNESSPSVDNDDININDNIEPENIDFDSYLPVFLYSHAEFPTLPKLDEYENYTQSTFANPDNRGENKYIEKRQDLFMEVPKNVIVVDPIMKSNLCVSYEEVDHGFPEFINKYKNSAFIKSKKYNESVNEITDGFLKKIINTFYNNKKVYFSDSTINNFSIVFDVVGTNEKDYGYKIPWNIRYKKTKDGKLDTLGILSRQYNLGREKDSSKRIMLKDVIKMIKEQINSKENIPDEYKNDGDVKIMLYLISCRGGDTKQEVDEKIYKAQQKVYDNGLYKITDRKLKHTNSLFQTPLSPSSEEDSEEEQEGGNKKSRKKRKRGGGKKKTRKKKYRQKRGGGKKKTRKKKYRKKSGGGGSSFKIMSWNILASAAVKHHKKNNQEETKEERGLRHDAIIRKINKVNPDVILLQEFDRHFMRKMEKEGKYEIITKFPIKDENSFTTAVLYKNDKFKNENDNDSELLYDKNTKTYDKKNAMRADLTFIENEKKFRFISLHLSGRVKTARTKLFNDIIKDINKGYCDDKIGIYGGDFNQVLPNPDENYSTCSFDYVDDGEEKKVLIDRIAYPNTHIEMKSYKVDKEPCNDGDKNDKDVFEFSQFNGSDHFPIVAEFMFIENESKSENESKKKSKSVKK